MPQMLEEQRESWGTRGEFILAAVGSAVGLGNLWGFPYKIYSYGGSAFLIPYVTAMLCVGIPMLILEFSLGHMTQRAAPNAFAKINKKSEVVGWWGIILGFVIITYYPVILAYCFSFMKYSIDAIISGTKLPWAGEGVEGVENAKKFFYETYLNYTPGAKLGAVQIKIIIPLLIAWATMYFCIFKGVKLVGKIVWLTVPLPWLMLLILTVRGMTLPGSMKGLVYYLEPAWSELAKPTTWRFAFGQVFFSLSLAFGVMVTYASFLHRKSDINNNAAIIVLADFATSFVAGLAIFATLGGMAYATQLTGNEIAVEKIVSGGPGLAFVAFPYALAQLPAATWWSFIFFFTLITLGIDSAFSITESVLAGIVDKTGWKRAFVLPIMSLVGLGFGLVYVTRGGLNWLETIDGFINGTWGIAFLGLLECVVLGWGWSIDRLRVHANERSDWQLGKWWNYIIRIFIPIVLGTLFMWSLFDDFTQENGFFKSPDGKWIIFNCVGIMVVSSAAIIAVIMSQIKGPLQEEESFKQKTNSYRSVETKEITAIILSLACAAMIAFVIVKPEITSNIKWNLLIVSIFLSIPALLLSNFVLDKKKQKTTKWPAAQWAGIISTFDISAFLTFVLVHITTKNKAAATETIPHTKDYLGGVSYIILSVAFMIIAGGLGWCLYRALTVNGNNEHVQRQNENNN